MSSSALNNPRIRIIGLGSPHGDDQVGWNVIEHLQQLPDISAELLRLDRPGPALLNYLSNCDKAILVDACDAGWQPGEVKHLTLAELLTCAELQQRSSHQLGLAETLQLAVTVDHPLPEIECYLIQLANLTPLSDPGPEVTAAAQAVTAMISRYFCSSVSG